MSSACVVTTMTKQRPYMIMYLCFSQVTSSIGSYTSLLSVHVISPNQGYIDPYYTCIHKQVPLSTLHALIEDDTTTLIQWRYSTCSYPASPSSILV